MKFGDILKSASTNLMRNKGRTILTIVAIFIGSFTIALTNGVNIGVNDYIDKQVGVFGGKDMMMISPKVKTGMVGMENSDEPQKYDPEKKTSTVNQNATLDNEDVENIIKIDGIKDAEPVKSYSINYVSGANDEKYIFPAMPVLGSMKVDIETGRSVNQTTKDLEINLAPEFVKSLGYQSSEDAVGKTVKLSITDNVTDEETIIEAKIVGVRNQSLMQGGNSLLNQTLIDELSAIGEKGLPASMLGQYGRVTAEMDKVVYSSEKETAALKERLDEAGYGWQTVEDEIGTVRNIINAITGVLTMFGAIALLAASFGIINTLFMSVQERTREIGLMKAMGLSSGRVFSIFSIEAALIGFLGSMLGILGAAGVGSIVNRIATDSFLSFLTGFTLIQFSWNSSGVIILIIMAIAFLAGTLPARRAAKLDPIESLRYE